MLLSACGGQEQGVALLAGDASAPAAANIPLDTASTRVMLRWVAARTGTARNLLLRVKLEGSNCHPGGRAGYAAGGGGVLEAATYPVHAATGRPRERALAVHRVAPCAAHDREGVAVHLGFAVKRGEAYATLLRNVDRDPGANWFSLNMLYASRAGAGPHGRDARRPARGGWTGLDAREAVGFSEGGRTMSVPGGPYGADQGRVFLPTYLVDYGGGVAGQPFYWALPARGVSVGRLAPEPRARRVSHVSVLLGGNGAGVVEVRSDGRLLGRARVRGGGEVRAPLHAVLPAGREVEVRARVAAHGLPIPVLFADPSWAERSGFSGLPAAVGHRGGAVPIRLLGSP